MYFLTTAVTSLSLNIVELMSEGLRRTPTTRYGIMSPLSKSEVSKTLHIYKSHLQISKKQLLITNSSEVRGHQLLA